MLKCPYNNSCIKSYCDLACSDFSSIEHWCNRCDIAINNPVFQAPSEELALADKILKLATNDSFNSESNFMNIGVYCCNNPHYIADLTSYVAICRYCKNIGFYNGVYKLNFAKYLDEIKNSWNTRSDNNRLEDMKIWINSAKYLIIYNLSVVRFGDFESQTMLSLFHERYDVEKFTTVILESGKFSLPGKPDSLFYNQLKREFTSRGARI